MKNHKIGQERALGVIVADLSKKMHISKGSMKSQENHQKRALGVIVADSSKNAYF